MMHVGRSILVACQRLATIDDTPDKLDPVGLPWSPVRWHGCLHSRRAAGPPPRGSGRSRLPGSRVACRVACRYRACPLPVCCATRPLILIKHGASVLRWMQMQTVSEERMAMRLERVGGRFVAVMVLLFAVAGNSASAQEHKTYRCKVADVVRLENDGRLHPDSNPKAYLRTGYDGVIIDTLTGAVTYANGNRAEYIVVQQGSPTIGRYGALADIRGLT